jgi:hypothetical protein
MFDKVKAVIDEWDPIELLSIHCEVADTRNCSDG